MNISQELLKEQLRYENGRLFWNVKRQGVTFGTEAGRYDKDGYVTVFFQRKSYRRGRLVWFYHYGEFPKAQIDHINHIRDDDRIENLREATSLENSRNRVVPSTNKLGVVGVYWDQARGKYYSHIKLAAKRKFLGRYDNLFDACCARKSAEINYGFHENHGKQAKKNYSRASG